LWLKKAGTEATLDRPPHRSIQPSLRIEVIVYEACYEALGIELQDEQVTVIGLQDDSESRARQLRMGARWVDLYLRGVGDYPAALDGPMRERGHLRHDCGRMPVAQGEGGDNDQRLKAGLHGTPPASDREE
jgi:hypothetical protein